MFGGREQELVQQAKQRFIEVSLQTIPTRVSTATASLTLDPTCTYVAHSNPLPLFTQLDSSYLVTVCAPAAATDKQDTRETDRAPVT